MELVNVIVPLFHGKKYINDLIGQIENCMNDCAGNYRLKLILINDDPSEKIGHFVSEKIEVEVIETDKNRGIHGARVRGLEYCTGDYVLFLDQDDKIVPDYFASQLSYIGNADAVVCKLLHGGRQYYDTRMPFEQVITRDYLISVRNSIISPGQVLIRTDKIPAVWKKAELKKNGADDWLLWICMLGTGARFSLNPEILFEHVMEGGNESINAAHMIASEREIYRVLSDQEVLTEQEEEIFWHTIEVAADDHIKLLSKFQKMFFVYDDWIRLQENGKYIHEYLKKNGVESVAIYGDSYIGKRLHCNLKKNAVEVRYFIDRNAVYLDEEIPVYIPQAGLPYVDLIIISLVENVEEISKELTALTKGRVCSISELLSTIKNAM